MDCGRLSEDALVMPGALHVEMPREVGFFDAPYGETPGAASCQV